MYTTHCIACHTTEIHWRDRKLARDWATLNEQVRRWATNAGQSWSDDDVLDVARYLNAAFYRYATPPAKAVGQRDSPPRLTRAD